MERLSLLLTGAQADQVRWALDPMTDFWTTEYGANERGGVVVSESVLPALTTTNLKKTPFKLSLSPNDEINSDLLYRLEVQAQDMAAEDEDTATNRGHARAALGAATVIRRNSPTLRDLPMGGGWC